MTTGKFTEHLRQLYELS